MPPKPTLRVIDSRQAGDQDIVGVGDDLRPDTLVWAYQHGIFPWPMPDLPLFWFCPAQRAVLDFDRLHVPRRLARRRRQTPLRVTIDTAFGDVIRACQSAPRPGQDGTWITPAMRHAYTMLYQQGHAHSVEAWTEDGALAGGLYGVEVGGVFSGESMFHRVPDASKLALLFLIDHLASRGSTWMDIQMMTPHMQTLGATVISRANFLDRLEREHRRGLTLFSRRQPPLTSLQAGDTITAEANINDDHSGRHL